MNLGGSLHLGLAYLRRQRAKTLLLIGALTLTLVLPAAIRVVVGDEVLDASVKARLEQMKVALTA